MEPVELTAADCAEAVALWEQAGLTRPWNDPVADFMRALTGTSSAVLGVRRSDGALIGTVMVGNDGHRGWVYYLAVSGSAQGTGLGRMLMRGSEAWLTALGIPKIQFLVREGNEKVLEFYERLGYQHQEAVVLGRRLDGDGPVGRIS